MRKILILTALLFSFNLGFSQIISDEKLEDTINLWIVTNNTKAITAAQMNTILNYLNDNKLHKDSLSAADTAGSGGGTGLERLSEGGQTGWRLVGRNPLYYGNIGNEAIDFSYSGAVSSTMGATGSYSSAFGSGNQASGSYSGIGGYASIASGSYSFGFGAVVSATGTYSTALNFYTTASGIASFAGGWGLSTYRVTSSGDAAFNFSKTSTKTSDAAADKSAILGGLDNTIVDTATGAVILGGTTQTATQIGVVYLEGLKVEARATLPTTSQLGTIMYLSTDSTFYHCTNATAGGAVWELLVDTTGLGGSGSTTINSLWIDDAGVIRYPRGSNINALLYSTDDSVVFIDQPYVGDVYRKPTTTTTLFGMSAVRIHDSLFRVIAAPETELKVSWFKGVTDSLNAYITTNGTINTIVVDTLLALSEDWTIPADMTLRFEGGMITTAYTITPNNTTIDAPLTQIFATNVLLSLPNEWKSKSGIYPPEWFGAKDDSTVNSTVAFRKTLRSFKRLNFDGHYLITDSIHVRRYDIIEGTYRSKIYWNQDANTNNLFQIKQTPVYMNGNWATVYVDIYGANGNIMGMSGDIDNSDREGGQTSPYVAGNQFGRFGFYIGNWNFKGFNWIAPACTFYPTGDSVVVTTSTYSSGFVEDLEPVRLEVSDSLPTGLDEQKVYYTIKLNNNSFQLAATLADAIANTAVNFTSDGGTTKVNIFTNESPNGIVLTQNSAELYFATIEGLYTRKLDTVLKVYSLSAGSPTNGWHYHNITFDTPIGAALVIGDPRFLGNNHLNIFSNMVFQNALRKTTIYIYEPGNIIQGSYFDALGDSCIVLRAGENTINITGIASTEVRDFSTENNITFNDYAPGTIFARNTTTGLHTKVGYFGEISGISTIEATNDYIYFSPNGTTTFTMRSSYFAPRSTAVSPTLGTSAVPWKKFYSAKITDDGTNVRLLSPDVYQGATGEEAITKAECKSLANTATITLPTGVNYIGKVWVKETGAFVWATLDVQQDGTVTLGTDKRGTVGTTSGGISSLNIYDGGTGAVIENLLGSTKVVCYKIEY